MSSASTNRYRERGIEIRPGSVRKARSEAGLSLAQVAGTDVTRGAVHLVETGQSRPSITMLRLIARRTGKPIGFFLPSGAELPAAADSDLAIAELERLAAGSDHAALLASASRLIERGDLSEAVRGVAFLQAARASALLADGSSAQKYAEQARRLLVAVEDRVRAVDALNWLGVARQLTGDPGADATFTQALEECRRLDPMPPELEARILTNHAMLMVAIHDWDRALTLYKLAVEAAGNLQDLPRMARVYDGLALAHKAMGNYQLARQELEKALGIYAMLDAASLEARTRTNYAELLLRLSRAEEAKLQSDKALDRFRAAGMRGGLARVLLVSAEAALSLGDVTAASAALEEAMATAKNEDDVVAQASIFRLQATIADRSQDRRFRSLYEAAIELLEEAGSHQRAAEIRREYATALESAGDVHAALEQMKAAADDMQVGVVTARPALRKAPSRSG